MVLESAWSIVAQRGGSDQEALLNFLPKSLVEFLDLTTSEFLCPSSLGVAQQCEEGPGVPANSWVRRHTCEAVVDDHKWNI